MCFDTGGISIKPADGMEDMKWDMGGAGAVAGLMHVLAGRKAKVNAVGILGLVENMPDGNAYRPGERCSPPCPARPSEVINTDAEGRLVLADAVWYCQDRFKPKFMVDLATLTGAIIIALGNDYAGCYANDEELGANLLAAAGATRRAPVAHAAAGAVRQEHRLDDRRHEEHRRPAGRLDHRGHVHPAFHQRRAVGAPGYRLHRLEEAPRPFRPFPTVRPASACGC